MARDVDLFLQKMHTEKCDVINVFAIDTNKGLIGIVYREHLANVFQETPEKFKIQAAEIYELYPRKQGKRVGLAKLAKTLEKGEDFDRLMNATRAFADFHKNSDKQYIPYFSTFVQQQLWDWVDKEQETDLEYDFLENEE